MNDFMFEPRCSICKDVGWLAINDKEVVCSCRVTTTCYDQPGDFDDDIDDDLE